MKAGEGYPPALRHDLLVFRSSPFRPLPYQGWLCRHKPLILLLPPSPGMVGERGLNYYL